jgi:hypothetical protein
MNKTTATARPWKSMPFNGLEEDYDFALKAVNNHDALLEAVKLALHVHIDYVRESGDDSQEANEYQAKLEQAIINATQR